MAEVEIANYPFTTIDANHGVAFLRTSCPCGELGLENCSCMEGNRFVPVELIDVAGLVPDAYKGRGLGNEFLSHLSRAQVLIHVVDASGGTDIEGNPVDPGTHDPLEDIAFLEREIDMWILGILKRNWQRVSRKAGAENLTAEQIIAEQLGGIGVSETQVKHALKILNLSGKLQNWSEEDLRMFVSEIRKLNKPIIIAANKTDVAPLENIRRLRQHHEDVIPISAAAELALKMAANNHIIKYLPGDADFTVINRNLSAAQRKGLEKLKTFLRENHGTGVQQCINRAVLEVLRHIVVYPVEDEHKCTDKQGRVLPDAFIVEDTCTARQLAYIVHTDIGEGFLFAVDAKNRMRVGEKHQLKHGDVIKIVSTK